MKAVPKVPAAPPSTWFRRERARERERDANDHTKFSHFSNKGTPEWLLNRMAWIKPPLSNCWETFMCKAIPPRLNRPRVGVSGLLFVHPELY